MKETYSIYIGRLPSGKWKVGCDINYPNRPKQQKMKIYTCIETHDCVYMASDREIELQLKYFGKRDSAILYHETLRRGELAWKRNTGSTHSEETKLKMSKAQKGRVHSKETKLKMSKVQKGITVGSKNGNSKLTDADVVKMRAKYKPHVYTIKMLVEEYNVSKDCIIAIIHRRNWTHI